MTDLTANPAQDSHADLGNPDTPLWLVDFDHTLMGANSTELFVGQCQPSLIVALIDGVVRRLIPWKLTRLPRWFRLRDYAIVLCIALLAPWNLWLWRRRAPALFARHESDETRAMLAHVDPSRIVIISFGSRFVIRALLRGTRYENCRIIATPGLASLAWFRSGKADIARDMLGEAAVRGATVLTDSEDDRDLLDACADGRLITPQGRINQASHSLYLPLRYSADVKFTRTYVIDQWLLVDSCIYFLCVAQSFAGFFQFAVIAPLLCLSFMCVYETGYFENDMQAALREKNPTLSGKEAAYRHFPMGWQSWLWAMALAYGALSAAVAWGALPQGHLLISLGQWAGALLAVRGVFWAYNRVSTRGRMYLYPLLQLAKYGPMALVFKASPLGLLLVLCQIFTMWVNYVVYRLGGDTKLFPKETFRYLAFVLCAMLALCALWGAGYAQSLAAMMREHGLSAVAILAWLSARVAKAALFRSIKARQA